MAISLHTGHFVSKYHFASKHHFTCNIISFELVISFENTIPLKDVFSFEVSYCLKLSISLVKSFRASNVQFDPLHNICCVYDEKLPKMAAFKEILEFMKRLPNQKDLTNQHNLVREVLDFADDEDSPTKFLERMVKGCMLRMGYNGPLNSANYLKSCFSKPYKFFIHSIDHGLSHRRKYNFSRIIFHYMKENITSGSKAWLYPRFVQMMIDHAYPDLEKDENNDLLPLYHMDNEMLIVLSRYHKNHPESTTKAEFFGFIKSADYQDPDPVDYQKWRNDEEMKEKSVADELKVLPDYKATRNEWFTKEEKKKRSRKTTPKVQPEEGSSSQPKKKRQKKVVETLLVDEPEEEEPEADAE
ncbi:hypothetical protein Hanom_Chr05g00396731 [Helianthus anomalus]